MSKKLFRGVCTALVTPFGPTGIDYRIYDQLVEYQIQNGVAGLVVCGTTGESATLSDREKLALIRHTVETVDGRCLVIAGTGSNDTAHALALSQKAEQLGADGLLVVSPYYNKATPSGLVAHYETIADGVEIPIIVYNVPSRTGVDIPVSVYEALAKHPRICGVKEAGGSITKIAHIRAACPGDFAIWSGNDDQIVPVLSLGGDGVISVLSNLLPRTTVELVQSGLAGNFKKAGKLQCALTELIDGLFCEVNPIPIKAALRMAGLDVGPCRLPLTELTPEHAEKLKILLEQYQVNLPF